MPKATLILLLTLLAVPPVFAAKSLTVEQLSNEVESLAKTKDSKAAGRLYGLQLTQRLSAKKLAAFEADLPGPDSRRALVALADQAEFLDPPPAETPNKPAPSIAEQRAIIAKSITYVEAMLHRFPNLFARRDTIRYEDMPPAVQDVNREHMSGSFSVYQPLHPVSRSIVTVLYRDGKEVVQKGAAQEGGKTASTGMITFGEFGPLFSVLYGDLPDGGLRWGYWEQGKSGLQAVFRFNVPKPDSHYLVRYCCIDRSVFQQFPAYHGEITIDPSNGTILRVVLIADMAHSDPMSRSELMVEYNPVELGGKKYFCPTRSLSITRTQVHQSQNGAARDVSLYATRPQLQTMLNETVFNDYHLFRGDVQILTANNVKGEPTLATPPTATPQSAASPSMVPTERTYVASESAGLPPSTTGRIFKGEASSTGTAKSATSLASTAHLNASPTTPAASPKVVPAVSAASINAKAEVANPNGVNSITPPGAASAAASSGSKLMGIAAGSPPVPSGKSGFLLSVNARLVDVDVTAVDKKGRPVTGLTKNDFVIYDNGKKQALRSFSPAGSASASPQSFAAAQPDLYTNLPTAVGGAHGASGLTAESSTILFLDSTSLDFPDLNFARGQILKFLDQLPKSEPVGLYVRTGLGFQILAEESSDHAALSSVLRKWLPNTFDLADAQEVERRNKEQFDTVESAAALGGSTDIWSCRVRVTRSTIQSGHRKEALIQFGLHLECWLALRRI